MSSTLTTTAANFAFMMASCFLCGCGHSETREEANVDRSEPIPVATAEQSEAPKRVYRVGYSRELQADIKPDKSLRYIVVDQSGAGRSANPLLAGRVTFANQTAPDSAIRWDHPAVVSATHELFVYGTKTAEQPLGLIRCGSGGTRGLIPVLSSVQADRVALLVPRWAIKDATAVAESDQADVFFLVDSEGETSIVGDYIHKTIEAMLKQSISAPEDSKPREMAFGFTLLVENGNSSPNRKTGLQAFHWRDPINADVIASRIKTAPEQYMDSRSVRFQDERQLIEAISWRPNVTRVIVYLGSSLSRQSLIESVGKDGNIIVQSVSCTRQALSGESHRLKSRDGREELAEEILKEIKIRQREDLRVYCDKDDLPPTQLLLTEDEYRKLISVLVAVTESPERSEWLRIPRTGALNDWLALNGLPRFPGLYFTDEDVLTRSTAYADGRKLIEAIITSGYRKGDFFVVPGQRVQ